VVVLLMLGSVLTSFALLATWAKVQLLDSQRFSDTSIELLEDDAIRAQLSEYLVTEVSGGRISAEQEARLQETVKTALDSAPARRAWETAVTDAHAQLVELVQDPAAGDARLDLARLVRVTAEQVGIPASALDTAPESYRVTILRSNQLEEVRDTADQLERISTILLLATGAVLLLAVALAVDWRRGALAGAAVAVAVGAAVVLIARALVGDHVVSELAAGSGADDAAQSAWSIGTSMLATFAVVAIVVAAIVVAAAAFARRPKPNPLGPGGRRPSPDPVGPPRR
jgi:hypothetical protein